MDASGPKVNDEGAGKICLLRFLLRVYSAIWAISGEKLLSIGDNFFYRLRRLSTRERKYRRE